MRDFYGYDDAFVLTIDYHDGLLTKHEYARLIHQLLWAADMSMVINGISHAIAYMSHRKQ